MKKQNKTRTVRKRGSKKSVATDIVDGEFVEIKTASKYDEGKRKSLIESLVSDDSNSEDVKNEPKPSKSKSAKKRKELVDMLVKKEDTIDIEDIDVDANPFDAKPNSKKQLGSNNVMLVHWNGRFGNRMHTYAYMHARAKKFGGKLFLPSDWEGKHLFNLDYEIVDDEDLRLHLNQSIKPFDDLSYRLKRVEEFNGKSGYNFKYVNADNPNENFKKLDHDAAIDSVCAYHHSIFSNMKLADVLKLYEFKDEIKNLDIYKQLEDRQGTYDIAHLRRDDISNVNYKNNGGYSVISKDAYLKAFDKYDYDPNKVEWTTDDWSSKWGVGNPFNSGLINKRGNWSYPVGAEVLPDIVFDWLPDFLRIYFARSIFRANSSFSFWACTLSKGRENPPKIFAPRLDHRILYAKEETFEQETEFDFEEGNHPHWLCIQGKDQCDDIVFSDEKKPKKPRKSRKKK
jgi:hypothetical protein